MIKHYLIIIVIICSIHFVYTSDFFRAFGGAGPGDFNFHGHPSNARGPRDTEYYDRLGFKLVFNQNFLTSYLFTRLHLSI